ncbi:MAG: N-methyl-D-aspartate receptor NMDAR2C subunit [Planctomycetota bacterium]|nr:N-methyl-D-aspartate receptor NMDAR2C subunit [Planctomycetota bacterium]
MSLTEFWLAAWDALGLRGSDRMHEALLRRYAEPHRAYHNLQHISECEQLFAAARHLCSRPGEVAVAIWFHDAVYDTHAADNEQRSAELASIALRDAGAIAEVSSRVQALILTTSHSAPPETGDEAVLVDIDLAILGSGSERFQQYETQIRQEYSWVPETTFREKRREVLLRFADRPSIYSTAFFQQRFEQNARENLARAIAALMA